MTNPDRQTVDNSPFHHNQGNPESGAAKSMRRNEATGAARQTPPTTEHSRDADSRSHYPVFPRNAYLVALAAITVLGLLLRWYAIDTRSLWLDESLSYFYSTRNVATILTEPMGTNPPLYYLLLHFWRGLFGDSEVSLRSLSLVFGIASIPLSAVVGALLFDHRAGLLAALFMAVSVFPQHYSVEARTFALFLFLILGSFYFLIRMIQEDLWRHWIGYFFCAAAMCYSHYYFVFILLAQNLYMLLFHRDRLLRWMVAQIAVLIVFSPWLLVLINQTQQVMHEGFWIRRHEFNIIPLRSFVAFLVHPYLVWLYIALAVRGLLPLAGTKSKVTSRISLNSVNRSAVLLLWLLCPFLVPFIISQIFQPIVDFRHTVRYLIGAAPPFYLLIACGFWKISAKWLRVALCTVMAFVAIHSLSNYYNYVQTVRPQMHTDWHDEYVWYGVSPAREWLKTVRTNLQPRDVILVFPGWLGNQFEYYSSAEYEPLPESLSPEKNPAGFEKLLEKITRGKKRLWLFTVEYPIKNELRSRFKEIPLDLYPPPAREIWLRLALFDLTKPASEVASE